MIDPLVILPNVAAVLSTFLQAQAEVADLVDDRVYTAIPKRPTYPLVRITLITETKESTRPLWIVRSVVQIEAYGGRKAEAHEIARTCEGVMAARMVGPQSDAVVVGVDHGALLDLPDEDHDPAKPRYVLTSTLTSHPAAIVSS